VDAHPDNPNQHEDAQIADLAISLKQLGQYKSVALWRQANGRYITIAGHGLIEAARREGLATVKADIHPPEASPAAIRAALVADNEHARHSVVDEQQLAELLESAQLAGYDLHALGSSGDELDDLKARLADAYLGMDGDEADDAYDPDNTPGQPRRNPDLADGVAADEGEAGNSLERLSLDLVEPAYLCARGEVWWIASPDRVRQHVLICCDVFTAWQTWQPWLVRQCSEAAQDQPTPLPVLFMPFPGPFLALSRRARSRRLVLVQPDRFIAGHILSKAVEVYGSSAIGRAEQRP
jgi:hypothetical protein